jgi:general secretion pathway protein L
MNKIAMMPAIVAIRDLFSQWIDCVADFVFSLLGRFSSLRTVRLIEVEDGEFVPNVNQDFSDPHLMHECIRLGDGQIEHANSTALAALSGNQIELVLQSDRFIFRPLELPNQATEFIAGIVRSQIDRLTPWDAAESAFGWSKPIEVGGDRMAVTIAATTFALIRPYVKTILDAGAHSIAVFTTSPQAGSDAAPIKVWEEKGRGAKNIGQIRRALVATLAAATVTTAVAVGANAIVSASLLEQQSELARQISRARAAIGVPGNGGLISIATVRQELERRKHDTPISVLVLETLSKILPDSTYVTELRIEGDKLRLTGVTHDAPSLIGLIEQSGRFKHATFFAPTTRSPSDRGDRFNIEAIIQPLGPTS